MTIPMRRARGGGALHQAEPAALLRRDPFADAQELLNRIGGLVEQTTGADIDRPWIPAAEIDETDDAYVVRLELPGIAPAEIEVGVRDNELCINGEVREEDEESDALRVRVGRFHYHTALPSDVDADHVDASLDEGILKLRIPKAQEGRARRIEVTGGRSEDERSRDASAGGVRSGGAPAGGTRSGGVPLP
jgi:HSP20 family protein